VRSNKGTKEERRRKSGKVFFPTSLRRIYSFFFSICGDVDGYQGGGGGGRQEELQPEVACDRRPAAVHRGHGALG